MDSLVSLQYPNGRVHNTIVTTSTELKPGSQFDLYGRRWDAVGLTSVPRGVNEPRRMLCLSTAVFLTPEL